MFCIRSRHICGPVKYIEELFLPMSPRVVALVTQQFSVPGLSVSNALFPGLTIMHSIAFPGPDSCP